MSHIQRICTDEGFALTTQGAEESYLTVMPAKIIAEIDLVLN